MPGSLTIIIAFATHYYFVVTFAPPWRRRLQLSVLSNTHSVRFSFISDSTSVALAIIYHIHIHLPTRWYCAARCVLWLVDFVVVGGGVIVVDDDVVAAFAAAAAAAVVAYALYYETSPGSKEEERRIGGRVRIAAHYYLFQHLVLTIASILFFHCSIIPATFPLHQLPASVFDKHGDTPKL